MEGLTIGRIVWYYHPAINERRPAIVTRVIDKDQGIVGLYVFLDANDPPGIPIDPHTGQAGVSYFSENDEPCSWKWPERG